MMPLDIKETTGHNPRTIKNTFQIAPFSPVFIGSGEKLRNNLDFFSSKYKTNLLDLNSLFRKKIDDLDALEAAVFKTAVPSYIRDSGMSPEEFIKTTYSGDCKSEELSVPVTDGFGNPMIPGSSIKGSIRSALLAYFLEQNNVDDKRYLNLISKFDQNKNKRVGKNAKSAGKDIEELILSTYAKGDRSKNGNAPNYDLGRVFRVGDATFVPDSLEVFNVAIINEVSEGYQWFVKREGNRSRNDSLLYNATKIGIAGLSFDPETARPASFTISLDYSAAESIEWTQPFDIRTIASACNAASRKVLQNDLDYMNEAVGSQSNLESVITSIEELMEELDAIEEENKTQEKLSWLQRIGWGSGYLSMTGAHASENMVREIQKLYRLGREGYEYPKTRRIALDLDSKPDTMMGWVLVEEQ